MAYSSNPPLGLSGAPGEGTCAGCHGPLTSGSGVGVTFPGGLTYTPGGPPTSLVVALTSGTGGFELSTRALNNNGQAGTLAAGTASGVSTSGSIQYAYQSSRASTWTLSWTPPATNVGNVVVYANVVQGGSTFANSFTLTPATSTPAETIAVSPTTLTFAYSGTAPPSQMVQVTSSGAAIAYTTSVSTTSGGNWLSATPAGGNTPQAVSVSVNPAGLATGTYTGTVSVASTSATNSPQSIAVTFSVTATPPPVLPTITSMPTALSFDIATVGGTATAQSLAVTSSDASPLVFAATASTTSGGNWLAVSPASGTAPASFSVSVTATGLAAGTYMGAIALTSAGAANSPFSVPVTLTIGGTPPPTTVPLNFRLYALAKQSGGSDELLITGRGAIDNSGKLTGRGQFTRFAPGRESEDSNTRSTGTWTTASVVSFTPISATNNCGGVLVIKVNLKTAGGSTTPATMRIASTGSDSGVTLTITGGDSFAPTGTGHVSITSPTGSCSSPGEGRGDDDGGEDDSPSHHDN